ncbi:helix-turn-helix domain-containing protein [Kamptonema formosum]|uniref:helix-turn-helix domain-containing protein n=1 Tax=Kamptonema formosum TaxID=331992 RepID=UPI000362145D|nr:helix-turn-helix domain-containing protein [Kamptonema formosum]
MTPKQIEDATGVSVELLYDWIKLAGISRGHNSYPKKQKEECLSLYVKGASCGEIEALTGISRATVGDWVKQANLGRKPCKGGRPPKYSPDVKQACLELFAQGKSVSQIEEKLNISPLTIRRWRREAERLAQSSPNCPVLDGDDKDL